MINQSMKKILVFSLLIGLVGTLQARKKAINCALNCICQKINTLTLGCDMLQRKADQIIACTCCPEVTYISQTGVTYNITTPGTYVLCTDLNVQDGTPAIVVAAPNVSLDLAGKTITAQTGVAVGGSNVHIFNGSILSFGRTDESVAGNGIVTEPDASNLLIEHILLDNGFSSTTSSSSNGLALYLNGASDVIVRDCTVTHNTSNYRSVISCQDCENVVFDNCFIADNAYAKLITMNGSSQIFLQNCEISGNSGSVLPDSVTNPTNYVVFMEDTVASSITNCKFMANRPAADMNSSAIYIHSSEEIHDQYNTIMNCQLIDNKVLDEVVTGSLVYGIDIESSRNHIEGCLINGISGSFNGLDVAGIACGALSSDCSYNTIEKCTVESVAGAADGGAVDAEGIEVIEGDNNDVEDCVVQHIGADGDSEAIYGIYVDTLNNNTIVRNKVFDYGTTENDYGIYLANDPEGTGAVIGNTVGLGNSGTGYSANVVFVTYPYTGNNAIAYNIYSGYTNVLLTNAA